ncbi:DUF4168 domain-containing protein [Pantanalinema rosaneae CENA516]|uniref:DUF4168 domain-containing protein n=1 Tax=Pantanalinema rosaneae TaxID=1620701 RepID=UPI003D700503
MLKQILASCSLVTVLAVSTLPVQAQTPPAQQPTAPTAAPTQVSSEELKKFASAVKQMLVVTTEAETQMMAAVQKEGLSPTRFREIYQSQRSPQAKPTNPVTPKEQQSYNQAVSQLTKIQQDAQVKMDKIVESEGLNSQRFGQIFATVRGDEKLWQEVQKLIQN